MEISKKSTDIAKDIVKNRSKILLGRGTMIMAIMETKKATTVKSLNFPNVSRYGKRVFKILGFALL